MDDVQIEENIDLIGVEELGYRFQTPVSASKRAVLLSYVSAILVIILSVGWFIFAAYTATKLMMLTELISLLLGICVLFLLKKGFISFAKHLLIIGLLSWMVATIVILSGPGGAERGGVHFSLYQSLPVALYCFRTVQNFRDYFTLLFLLLFFYSLSIISSLLRHLHRYPKQHGSPPIFL